MKEEKLKEVVLILIIIILSIFLVKYLNIFKYLGMIFNVLIPVFIGLIYAWIFNPLISKLSKKYNRNIICIVLFLLIIFCFGLFIYFFVPMFYKELLEFINIIPEYYTKLEIKVDDLGLKDTLDKVINYIFNNVFDYLISFGSSLFKYVGVIVVGLILGLYVSMDYEKIVSNVKRLVPKKYKRNYINLSYEVSDTVRKCVNGTLLIASFVFLLDSIVFFFIGLNSPLLLGIICGVTDLIPYVGPYIGGAIAVLVGFTESKVLGIVTLIACFIVQALENYVLQPIIMSKSIKISPILVMISLLIFGKLFGIVGMLFATPCLAFIKVILCKLVSFTNVNIFDR